MVSGADDFGAWLIGLLADAGRKKLTAFVLGTEQERALRLAARAAVIQTAEELFPDDDRKRQDVVLVIGEVFSTEHLTTAHMTGQSSVREALQVAVAKQLQVLGDASLTDAGVSSAELLGVTDEILANKLNSHLLAEIAQLGTQNAALHLLASQLNDDLTHMQGAQTHAAVQKIGCEILAAITERDGNRAAENSRVNSTTDTEQLVHELLDDLGLGDHEEAERRVFRLFLHLLRCQQKAAVDAILHVATSTDDHTTQLLAGSLLEAADRLDPMLVTIEAIEALAVSDDYSLRSCGAVLMWQWAESNPGRVPIPLLCNLAQPSTEDWYVHAAARACAKELLLRRSATRAIFDLMAASSDRDSREYAVKDLREVAAVEPVAVPRDLVRRLMADPDQSVAAQAAELVPVLQGTDDSARRTHYGHFAM